MTEPEDSPGLRAAIALSDLLLDMRLQRLREENPGLSEREVVRMFNKELADRPPDGPGVSVAWPRR